MKSTGKGRPKLKRFEVEAIRQRISEGVKYASIAAEFRVSTATVTRIKQGRSGKRFAK